MNSSSALRDGHSRGPTRAGLEDLLSPLLARECRERLWAEAWEWAASFVDEPPKTQARFAFFAGALNACFEAESQVRTQAWFESHDPGRHTLRVVPNYGHLDIFMGAHAAHDVFPDMLSELERT